MATVWDKVLGVIWRPTQEHLAQRTFADAMNKFGGIIPGFQHLEWEKLPEAAKEYIKEHPNATAMQVALSLTTLCPGLVVGPGLALLGFGPLGPTAGFAAAAFQSAWGTPLAFSAMQSAAMGGWGAAIVSNVVSAGSLTANVAVSVFRKG